MRPGSVGCAVFAAVVATVASACDPTEPFRAIDEERVVERVTIAPDSVSAAVRDTFQFAGTAIGPADRVIQEAEIAWTPGNPSIVRSIGDGRFVVVSAGTAELIATSLGRRGVARLVSR